MVGNRSGGLTREEKFEITTSISVDEIRQLADGGKAE